MTHGRTAALDLILVRARQAASQSRSDALNDCVQELRHWATTLSQDPLDAAELRYVKSALESFSEHCRFFAETLHGALLAAASTQGAGYGDHGRAVVSRGRPVYARYG